MYSAQTLGIPVNGSASPDYFILKGGMTENSVHDYPDVVTCRRVTVEIHRACGLQDAPHLKEPKGHIDQIG